MLQWVVSSAVKYRRAVLAVALVVGVAGAWQLRHARVDALPEFMPPRVEVQTEALGLSAEEVEQLVTVPLEQNFLNGIPFVDTISSQSVPGLSSVTLVFEPHTSLFTARQLVQERLSLTTELPNVSKPPEMLQAESSTSRLMMIGLSSPRLSPIDLSLLAKYVIRPRVLGVAGVADVAIWGQRDLQLQVQVDPQRLRALGVSLDQVITTSGNALFVSPLTFLEASTPGTGGFIDTANQRLAVQHLLPIKTAQDLARVVVVDTSGLRLSDVATVVQDHQPLIGDTSASAGSGLLLVVEKLPGANTVEVTNRVTDALNTLRPGLSGVNLDTSVYRPATFVETAIGNLRHAAVIGSLLLVLALALLFFDWQAALIAILTVPLSVIAAAYVLYLRHTTFDAMVVAGLVAAVAIVVHDAVVVTEAVRRRLGSLADTPATDKPLSSTVVDAVADVGRPIMYATVIAVVALGPLLFLAGLPSKPFLPPIAASFALAIAASLLTAGTVTPALATVLIPFFPIRPQRSTTRLAHYLDRPYRALLGRAVDMPTAITGLVGLLAVVGLVSLGQLHASLRPTFRETELVVQWDGPPGTSLMEMDRVLGRVQAELRSVPGVRDVGVQVGRAVSGDQVVAVDSAQLWVDLDPDADHDATVARLERVVNGYPGFSRQVFTYFNDRVKAAQPTTASPVLVRLYGPDFDVLHAKANEMKRLLGGIKGVVAPQVETQTQAPTIDVNVNLSAAQAHGIKPGDVRRAATTLVSGLDVGSLYEDQRVFQVTVVGTPSVRQNLTTVQDLLIDTPAGGHVRLGDVANVHIAPSLNLIKHVDVSRYLDVTAQVRGRSVGSVVADVHRSLSHVGFPLQYSAKVLSGRPGQSSANRRVAGAAALSAVVIFLLLQAAFESWLLAALAFFSVALSLVGGAVAVWATGGEISLGATAGFLAVGALAARGSVRLFTRSRNAERTEPDLARADVVKREAGDEMGPALGVAAGAAVAFLPMAAIGSVPGTELVGPMAAVILGGLVSLTLVNLLVLPVGYVWCLGGRRARVETPPTAADAGGPG